MLKDRSEVKLRVVDLKVAHVVYFHVLFHVRCGVPVWYGDHHPVHRSNAKEEDRCPSPTD